MGVCQNGASRVRGALPFLHGLVTGRRTEELVGRGAAIAVEQHVVVLDEEVHVKRARASSAPIVRSYNPPEEGAGYRDAMIIAFAGENNMLVRAQLPATSKRAAAVCARSGPVLLRGG